jgi:hypothetical protein
MMRHYSEMVKDILNNLDKKSYRVRDAQGNVTPSTEDVRGPYAAIFDADEFDRWRAKDHKEVRQETAETVRANIVGYLSSAITSSMTTEHYGVGNNPMREEHIAVVIMCMKLVEQMPEYLLGIEASEGETF